MSNPNYVDELGRDIGLSDRIFVAVSVIGVLAFGVVVFALAVYRMIVGDSP